MDDAANTTAKKVRGRPFQKGQVANPAGRPKGSRNKVSSDYIHALAEDFEKHGISVIERLRDEDPRAYIKCVADLVPKEYDLTHNAGDAFVALWQSLGRKSE